jgi:hypothetical protein
VAAAQILHEGVPGDHHLRHPDPSAVRASVSQPVLEVTMIGLDRVVTGMKNGMSRGPAAACLSR